jgi:arylsulfatase A-like enzyme
MPTPAWLIPHYYLDKASTRFMDWAFRERVRDVLSVDRLIAHLRREVVRDGQGANTVFVFSSDNGFHMGEYSLRAGKQTAFDTDIRVPLIVAGPHIAPGSISRDVAENVDLRPTFDEFAGASTPAAVDGRSLVPLLHGEHPRWRELALIEHRRPPQDPHDPDYQTGLEGNPPSYEAIRSPSWIYVRYFTGDREYYDIARDPYELHNLGPSLSPARVKVLNKLLDQLSTCHGAASCWDAAAARTN